MKYGWFSVLGVVLIAACGSPGSSKHATVAQKGETLRPGTKVIDVRTPAEYQAGHIPGVVNIPLNELEQRISEVASSKNTCLAIHCQSGKRSATAKQTLERLGYVNVDDLGSLAHARQVVLGE